MMNEIKKNEMNDMELKNVTGGIFPMPPLPEVADLTEAEEQRLKEQDEAIFNAIGTAWEVVKHAFEVCG